MSLTVSSNHKMILKDNAFFFYLADTCWSAFTNITDEEWEYYLNTRKVQGFNTIQINILPQWDASETNLKYFPFQIDAQGKFDYEHINHEYFEHARKMCVKAKECGFELALVVLWCNYVPNTWASALYKRGIMPKECISSYVTKVHETFSDLEPIYVVSGDTDFNTQETIDYYVTAGKQLKALAKHCLFTAHIKGRYTELPQPLYELMDFVFYQSGHNAQNMGMPYLLAEEMRQKYPNKPLINSEPCYEEMGYSRKMYGRWTRFDVRRAAWMSLLSGASAGITYGAAGIYSWHKINKRFGSGIGEGFDVPKCWEDALQFLGAWDYGYIQFLFSALKLNDLIPCQELLVNDTKEIRIAQCHDNFYIYLPINTTVRLNRIFNGYRAKIIDLEDRFIANGELTFTHDQTHISMHRFHQDVLIVLEKMYD